jgi:hypothetical protein
MNLTITGPPGAAGTRSLVVVGLTLFSTVTLYGILSGSLLPELLGKPDENSFGTTDIAEAVHISILDHFADELRAAISEPDEGIVNVLHSEHDAQVPEGIHRSDTVIGDNGRRQEAGQLNPAVAVRRTHHGNLDAHVMQPGDAICPASFNWGTSLESETKFCEEFNGGINVFDHDADVIHTRNCHDISVKSNVMASGWPAVK